VNEAMGADDRQLLAVLCRYINLSRAQGVLVRARREVMARGAAGPTQLVARLADGLRAFVGETEARAAVAELTRALSAKTAEAVEVEIKIEADIARARLAVRDMCQALGTSALILQKLATIVSELARNMVLYAGGGKLTLRTCAPGKRCLHVTGVDQGGGIKNLDEIMSGKYKSRSGLGLGLLGSKRLADKFDIQTGPGGTKVEIEVNF
jgi:serine/threonine-protein kinase RsbT